MWRKVLALAAGLGVTLATVGSALTDESEMAPYQIGDLRSGFTYAAPETQAMQEDEFENPGFIWVQDGEELWSTAEGSEGKAAIARSIKVCFLGLTAGVVGVAIVIHVVARFFA